MPLPVTPSFERALRDLRQISPATAALAERIALDLQPQVLPTSTDNLEEQLLDHLQAVGRQQARSATRFTVWANKMANDDALTHQQAATFVCEASTLAGPSGVVPE